MATKCNQTSYKSEFRRKVNEAIREKVFVFHVLYDRMCDWFDDRSLNPRGAGLDKSALSKALSGKENRILPEPLLEPLLDVLGITGRDREDLVKLDRYARVEHQGISVDSLLFDTASYHLDQMEEVTNIIIRSIKNQRMMGQNQNAIALSRDFYERLIDSTQNNILAEKCAILAARVMYQTGLAILDGATKKDVEADLAPVIRSLRRLALRFKSRQFYALSQSLRASAYYVLEDHEKCTTTLVDVVDDIEDSDERACAMRSLLVSASYLGVLDLRGYIDKRLEILLRSGSFNDPAAAAFIVEGLVRSRALSGDSDPFDLIGQYAYVENNMRATYGKQPNLRTLQMARTKLEVLSVQGKKISGNLSLLQSEGAVAIQQATSYGYMRYADKISLLLNQVLN